MDISPSLRGTTMEKALADIRTLLTQTDWSVRPVDQHAQSPVALKPRPLVAPTAAV